MGSRFFTFTGSLLNILEVRDCMKGVSRRQTLTKLNGDYYIINISILLVPSQSLNFSQKSPI